MSTGIEFFHSIFIEKLALVLNEEAVKGVLMTRMQSMAQSCRKFVIVSGAAATLLQQYGLPLYAGDGIILVLVIVMRTVVLGFRKIVDIISSITPIMIFLIVVILVISLYRNADNLQSNIEMLNTGRIEFTIAGASCQTEYFAYYGFQGSVLLWAKRRQSNS